MTGPARGTPHATSRSAVLDVIRAAGTISRVGLIQATGFTGATISTVVRRLIEDGLVVEVGRAESTGGKPRVLLRLNHTSRYAVGVHLDHAGIMYVLTDLAGAVVARIARPGAGAEDPPAVVARMAREVRSLIDSAGVDAGRVLGLGLVSPGPLGPAGGMRLTPPLMRHWEDFPLDQALAEAVRLPVVLDNDATASAVGEYWAGGIEPTSAFAALYMGTGIGAGVLVNGTVNRGASSNSGEIGHICVDVDGPPCWCGSRGCVEILAGPAAVVTAARAAGLDVGLPERPVAESFAAVARAALRGEPAAAAILQRSARYLAVAAHTLANIMDLDLVVLTGPSFALAGSLYLPAVESLLGTAFFARQSHAVRVTISTNASDSAAVGAAALVLQSELAPRQSGARMQAELGPEPIPVQGRTSVVGSVG